MTQYLLLKSDGERDDARYGLTADDTSNNGVLGGDTYSASHTAEGLFPGRGEITSETINGKSVTVENDNHGKWVCVLNYEHFGGENPSVAPSSTFPQLPNGLSRVEDVNALGTSGELRHVDNITQYGSWSVDAVRLEAETSNHGRRIHYYTTDQTAIDAIVDDSVQAGSAALQADFYYPDHTAALPDAGDSETQASTNRIFGYDFPIYEGGEHHWALAGSGNRWEVDDSGNENQTTVHRVWVRVDTNPEGGGGDTTITQSSSSSSASPLGNTQAAALADQLGSGTTSVTPTASAEVLSSSSLVGGGTTSALSNALRDAFAGSTFGGSFTDTTADGVTELFTHSDQRGALDTSSVSDALVESFDTVQRTAIGDALTGVTGDTTVATTNTTQSLGNALAEPLVAAETAALTAQDAGSFADTYVDALRASGSGLPTGAVGDTAVTSLGQTEVAVGTPQFDTALVEIFALVSPTSSAVTPRVGGVESTTNAVALTENAVMVPLTPTTDIVIQVRSGQLNVEGNFADSLTASVGASTFIKVNKKRVNATPSTGDLDTDALPDAIAATAEALEQTGGVTTDSTAEALVVAAALQSFGTSSTFTDTLGTVADVSGTEIDADGFSSATPDAAVRDAVASELDASASTSATSEALAEAAQTLTEQGLADTQTEAAALVAQVAAQRKRGTVDTFAGVEGLTETFDTVERRGRPSTFTLSDAARAVFNVDSIDTDAVAQALPVISSTLVSTVNVNGAASTESTSHSDVTDMDLSPTEALLRILFAAVEGSNTALSLTEQNVRISNAQNYVEVEN